MARKLPDPVIVVPGVTATYLRDLYPLPPETIWTVLKQDFGRAQMHPDDPRYEAKQPATVRPDQLYEIAYESLIEEMRHDLSKDPDQPVPVFPFGYDWRHPLKLTEATLAAFIDEVIDRTKLLRHYHKDGYGDAPRVNLVGHSMGGLVIAGYVERFGAAKVNRIATLATPFNGSFEAMVKMATGTANIGGSQPSSREREAARVTPSLYHLLPDFDTGIIVARGANLPASTFDPGLWQPSIIETIIDYFVRYGVDPGKDEAVQRERGEALFATLLATAAAHRRRTDGLKLDAKGFSADRWLCVVGAGTDTRVQMTVKSVRGKPAFVLTRDDRLDKWGDNDPETAKLTGDGTVHFKGAVPAFLPYESLVCVTPDDYGYWELQDRTTTKLAGFHGILPNMNMLHRMLVRFFADRTDPMGNT
ncbi:MAG TPA: alpha/beta hydrolase, partial [Thermohalobaculum sp.]|nr:alpha/beta hydrolase [Thermohalobaculum sp.]